MDVLHHSGTLDRHLWIFFLLPVVLGLLWPQGGLVFTPYALPLLFAVMTVSLLDVPLQQSIKSGLNRKAPLVLAIQYGLSGLLAWFVAPFFPPELFVGFILAAVAPSGISVPAMVDLYGGNKAIATSLTLLSHMLAPVFMPLLVLLLAGQKVPVDAFGLFQTVAVVIFLPMIIVFLLKQTGWATKVAPYRKQANLVLMTVLVWGQTAPIADYFYDNPLESLALFSVLLAMAGVLFFVGWNMSNKREDRMAYTTLSYLKNNSLSIVLLSQFFGPLAASVAVVQVVSGRVMASLAAYAFRQKK